MIVVFSLQGGMCGSYRLVVFLRKKGCANYRFVVFVPEFFAMAIQVALSELHTLTKYHARTRGGASRSCVEIFHQQ